MHHHTIQMWTGTTIILLMAQRTRGQINVVVAVDILGQMLLGAKVVLLGGEEQKDYRLRIIIIFKDTITTTTTINRKQ